MPCSDALSPAAFEQKQCFGAEKTTLGGGVERGIGMLENKYGYPVEYLATIKHSVKFIRL